MKCPPCDAGAHEYCVRRPEVDNPPGEWECHCTEEPCAGLRPRVTDLDASARTSITMRTSLTELPAVEWPDREAFRSALASRFIADANELAMAAPTTPSERAEVGASIARFMLAARDGATASQVVRTAVERLGPAEAMNAAETLALWAVELAAAAGRKVGA